MIFESEVNFWRLISSYKKVISSKNSVLSFNPVHIIVGHFKNAQQA